MKTSINKIKKATILILMITMVSLNLFGNAKEKDTVKKEETKKESTNKAATPEAEKNKKIDNKSTEKISFFKDGISINVDNH
jgi:hypothetical protein